MNSHASNLRKAAREIDSEGYVSWIGVCTDAATEIERLTAEIGQLRSERDRWLDECVKRGDKCIGLYDEVAKLRAILADWLQLRDWVDSAGGSDGSLPQDVIQKFAEQQAPIVKRAQQALSRVVPFT